MITSNDCLSPARGWSICERRFGNFYWFKIPLQKFIQPDEGLKLKLILFLSRDSEPLNNSRRFKKNPRFSTLANTFNWFLILFSILSDFSNLLHEGSLFHSFHGIRERNFDFIVFFFVFISIAICNSFYWNELMDIRFFAPLL